MITIQLGTSQLGTSCQYQPQPGAKNEEEGQVIKQASRLLTIGSRHLGSLCDEGQTYYTRETYYCNELEIVS